jgi:hypothetical protein
VVLTVRRCLTTYGVPSLKIGCGSSFPQLELRRCPGPPRMPTKVLPWQPLLKLKIAQNVSPGAASLFVPIPIRATIAELNRFARVNSPATLMQDLSTAAILLTRDLRSASTLLDETSRRGLKIARRGLSTGDRGLRVKSKCQNREELAQPPRFS